MPAVETRCAHITSHICDRAEASSQKEQENPGKAEASGVFFGQHAIMMIKNAIRNANESHFNAGYKTIPSSESKRSISVYRWFQYL